MNADSNFKEKATLMDALQAAINDLLCSEHVSDEEKIALIHDARRIIDYTSKGETL